MGSLTVSCKCGYRFPEYLGKYGCPNCEGDSRNQGARKITSRRNIWIHPADYQRLKDLGNGNASLGIRVLLERNQTNGSSTQAQHKR